MDTLADLASMQNHHPVRATPPPARDNSNGSHSLASLDRPSFDIAMVETPKELLRSNYVGSSLPSTSQQRLAELVAAIHEAPSAYEAHIEIIKILHQGFVSHIYPESDPNARNDPVTYDLLTELRKAREGADRLFAVGEDLWLEWLQDESILARTAEERVAVIELCKRAVEEEHGSPRLWQTYGDWVLHCYTWAHESSSSANQEEERLIGREVFQSSDVVNTWEEAVKATGHDMALSHLVWDKFLRTRHSDFEEKVSEDRAAQILDLFQARLVAPHARWEATFQAFSSFVSANFASQQYEQIMTQTVGNAAAVKAIWSAREQFEASIATAVEAGDKISEYQGYSEYIAWEKSEEQRISRLNKKMKKREPIQDTAASVRMIHALYQRTELRFPSVSTIWEDHARYLIQRRDRSRNDTTLLALLRRATRHCPWSGSLWKQLILASEIADQSFQATEAIYQDATKTGMLDAAGTGELLTVHDAWCGYLMRRTRRHDATEEDADVAEMGIRTSIEAVQTLASKGEANVDSSFRLQRKYIEYLKGQGRFDNARKQFDDAVPTYGKSYRFWLRFYEFEMQASGHITSLQQDSRDVILNSSSPTAVGILKKGIEYPYLDYPEYLIEALTNHCEDYEDAEELQSALFLVDKVQEKLTYRRQQEAEAAAQHTRPVPDEVVAEIKAEQRTETIAENLHIGKRKREEPDGDDDSNKRPKNDDVPAASVEQSTQDQPELKRDRENTSILVRHVPLEVDESGVRSFFKSCGPIIGLKTIDDDDERHFILEFKESDGAQYALTRNETDLEGAIISVSLNTGNILYVTNYPAAADEQYIRDLFHSYGKIVSIRFPSLKANKRRRFCYVELETPDQATAALAQDGKAIDDLELVVKISNPAVRKARDTTQSQGRTIFIGQLPFKAREKDLQEFFAQYGTIENCKMPMDPSSKSRNKGIAFITYTEKSSADAALQMNGHTFQERRLKISIAQDANTQRQNSVSAEHGRSASPALNNGTSAQHSHSPAPPPTAEHLENQRQRTIALADVPDTVNEAQIAAAAGKIGTVKKVLLRTQHGGALIEFENVADAGKAALAMDGHEFVVEKLSKVVTQEELKAVDVDSNIRAVGDSKGKKKAAGAGPGQQQKMMAPSAVRRPQQPGARRGGHLGQRSGLGFRAANANAKEGTNGDSGTTVAKKSNDDFRAMLGKK